MSSIWKFSVVCVALIVIIQIVQAVDYRLDFKPKKGQSVGTFCKEWKVRCPKVAALNHYRGTVNQVCERSPRKGIAQAYCTSEFHYESIQYTKEVGRDLGAKL
ncbi:hypothetical protein DM01DRAFT_1333548, partial [Hesseltinella vesiculosa]